MPGRGTAGEVGALTCHKSKCVRLAERYEIPKIGASQLVALDGEWMWRSDISECGVCCCEDF